MMDQFRLLHILAACLWLSACGGSGTPPTVDPPIPGPGTPPSTGNGGEKRDDATDLVQSHAPSVPITYTALSAIPTTGSATYNGFFYGDIDGGLQDLIGDMAMAIQFTSSSVNVSGTVSDFYDANDNALTGTLSFGGGALDRSGDPNADATFTATVTGSLSDGTDTLVFGAQLEGDFLGGTYDAIGGAAIGSVTIGTDASDFDGGFIAER